jgi:hypothetical protein
VTCTKAIRCLRCPAVDEVLQLLPGKCDLHKNRLFDFDAAHDIRRFTGDGLKNATNFEPESISVTSGEDARDGWRSWSAPTSLYWCTPTREELLLSLRRSKCSRLMISTTVIRRGIVAVDTFASGGVPGGGKVWRVNERSSFSCEN